MGVFDGGGTTAPATYPLRVHDIDNRGELASVLAVVDQDHTADLDKPCERLRTANGGKNTGGQSGLVRRSGMQAGGGKRSHPSKSAAPHERRRCLVVVVVVFGAWWRRGRELRCQELCAEWELALSAGAFVGVWANAATATLETLFWSVALL